MLIFFILLKEILVEFKLLKIIFLSDLILFQAVFVVVKVKLFQKFHFLAFIVIFIGIAIQGLFFLGPIFFVSFLTIAIFLQFFIIFHIHELLHMLYQNPQYLFDLLQFIILYIPIHHIPDLPYHFITNLQLIATKKHFKNFQFEFILILIAQLDI